MKKEIWKDVVGYEGLYIVSNFGNIKSLGRTVIKSNGIGIYEHTYKERMLSQQKSRKGYLRVTLSKNGKSSNFISHRLVAMAFIENENNYDQVNHLNGIKDDNRVENLEWCSNRENQLHAIRNGLVKKALSPSVVNDIVELVSISTDFNEISSLYNVSTDVISGICIGRSYSDITGIKAEMGISYYDFNNRPSQKGELNRSAKLSDFDAAEIRRLYSMGVKQSEISEKFNVTQSNISSIVNYRSFKHI